MTLVLVTGASGNAGQVTCQRLVAAGMDVRMADVTAPPPENRKLGEFVRCDTRTPDDARRAVNGVDAVVHLGAWHCGHVPPVSDATIWAVNVDGTYNIFEACREYGVQAVVYASSMAFGWGGVYSVTKVIGEDLCRMYHETTRASVAMLRYHDFVPKPYLSFGGSLLRNGVDRRDVADATVASVIAAVNKKIGLFRTIVHSHHGMPEAVRTDFARHGLDWSETQVPGSAALFQKYGISLPQGVEQHDLSDAKAQIGWEPQVNIVSFLSDLKERDSRGEDISALFTPCDLSVVG